MSDLRSQLTSIRDDQGSLTPEGVVSAATPEDHPLHGRFEWNDTVAGHEYRKVQARELIRSVKISFTSKGEEKSTRAFVSTKERESGVTAYQPTEEVVSNDFSRELLLRQARRDIDMLKRKYGHLEEFAALMTQAVA